MESASVEHYKEAHTVTEADHEAGLYLAVEAGDTIVFTIKETRTVTKEVVNVEGLPTLEVVAPKKKATKGNKIVAVGEDTTVGDSTVSDTVVA